MAAEDTETFESDEKPVIFETHSTQIAGMLHAPKVFAKSPCVILCHGFTGNKIESNKLFVKLARKLCHEDFVVLRFDFRGSGDSEGEFENMTISGELSDLSAAVGFVSTLPVVDANKIGALGLSLGSTVAICTAAEDERIKAVISWSGPSEFCV